METSPRGDPVPRHSIFSPCTGKVGMGPGRWGPSSAWGCQSAQCLPGTPSSPRAGRRATVAESNSLVFHPSFKMWGHLKWGLWPCFIFLVPPAGVWDLWAARVRAERGWAAHTGLGENWAVLISCRCSTSYSTRVVFDHGWTSAAFRAFLRQYVPRSRHPWRESSLWFSVVSVTSAGPHEKSWL